MSTQLAKAERAELARLEEAIGGGLAVFVTVGDALVKIREGRLYRETHATFDDYCRERWGMTKTHANRLIQSAEVVANVTPIGVTPEGPAATVATATPANEAQARPLVGLEPEQQREAWCEAVDTAPAGKVTAAHVASVVKAKHSTDPTGFVKAAGKGSPIGEVAGRGPAPKVNEEAAAVAGRFHTLLIDVRTVVAAVRAAGGLRKLAARWSPGDRREAAAELRKAGDGLITWAKELEQH